MLCAAMYSCNKKSDMRFCCLMSRGHFAQYRKWDSNPHSRNGQGILSPSCLPFHHFGSLLFAVAKLRIYLQPAIDKRELFASGLVFYA